MMIIGSKLPTVSKEGDLFILQIAALFSQNIAPWAGVLFKIGFFCGVFSSLLGVWQSVPYLYADIKNINKPRIDLKKTPSYHHFLIYLSLVPLTTLGIKFQSVQLLYAVVGAFFIPLCAVSLLLLFKRKNFEKDFKNTTGQKVTLSLIFLFFLAYGISIALKNFA